MAKHTVILSDYKAKKAEEGAIDIVAGDETFTVPPAALWPDEMTTPEVRGDWVAQAKLLLGDDAYARFVAAGGTAVLLQAIVNDELGEAAGE